MIREERRWASPAAAVLAFCWTLVMLAPPTIQPTTLAIPSSILADGPAALAAHLLLGAMAFAGLYVGAKSMLHRKTADGESATPAASRVHAA
jgi:hypothetical protein